MSVREKSSVYNQLSVYNQGGESIILIDDMAYSTVSINGVTWLQQNLLYANKSWTTGTWNTSNINTAPAKRKLPKCGFYYTKTELQYIIDNLDLKGFRVPTIDDFNTLINIDGDSLRSVEFWDDANGNNISGLNLIPTGHHTGSSFNSTGSLSELWTSDLDENGDFYNYKISKTNAQTIAVENQTWSRPIRLCK